jgi:hypothetical protein
MLFGTSVFLCCLDDGLGQFSVGFDCQVMILDLVVMLALLSCVNPFAYFELQ